MEEEERKWGRGKRVLSICWYIPPTATVIRDGPGQKLVPDSTVFPGTLVVN